MDSTFPFRRIFIADLSGTVDLDLLRYGAGVAALGTETAVIVAAPPSAEGPLTLHRSCGEAFGPLPGVSVSHQPLPTVDTDALFAAAVQARADLMLVRHPQRWPEGRQMARRLIEESPCAVWMVPEGAHPQLRRVVAEIGLSGADLPALHYACALGRCAGTKALVAVHVSQATTAIEDARSDRFLEVEEALARVDTGAMVCSVQVDHSHYVARSLQRAAEQHHADLLVVTAPPRTAVRWPHTRAESDDLTAAMPAALLSVQSLPSRPGWRDALRRLFASPEPAFN